MRAKTTWSVVAVAALAIVAAVHPAPALAADDAIVVYSAGIDGILVDKKDQVLRDALKLLDDRMMELPIELDEPGMPGPILKMVLEMLMSPMTMRMGMLEDADPAAGPPFYAQLTVGAETPDAARNQAQMLFQMISQGMGAEAAQDVPGMAGIKVVDLDGVPGYIGHTEIGQKPVFVAAINTVDLELPRFDALGLPVGVKPAFVMQFNSAEMQPLFEMIMAQAPPMQAELFRTQMDMMGLLGETPLSISAACGYGPDRAYGSMRLVNYAAIEMNAAMLVNEPLTREDLARIPADATYAAVGRMNFAALGDMLRQSFGQMAEMAGEEGMEGAGDPIEMIAQFTGIHLQHDVFDHMGTMFGYYMADTTGGGGLASLVSFAELSNEEGMRATLDKFSGTVNELAAMHAKGYVRVGTRTIAGRDVTTIMFPGLPVPLEISMAIENGYLYKALSPQSLIAAMDHARGRGGGLAENPRFRELAKGSLDGAVSMSFSDTPRLAREGYGLVSFGMAALANAVRSPGDHDRDPGLIMPSYADLMKGVKGSLTTTYIRGDDLLISVQSDRSVLVNITAGVGVIAGSPVAIGVAALGAGILMPALGKARESAKAAKSMAQLRQIAMAMNTYAAEHEDQVPQSLDTLIEMQYITPDLLKSPVGPAPDGGPDYWLNPSVKKMSRVKRPDKMIAAYDRASYGTGEMVMVLYFDGHVESVDSWTFEEMLDAPYHKDTDFDLPDVW